MKKEFTFNLNDAIFVKFYKSDGVEDIQVEVCVIPSDSIMFSAIASIESEKIDKIQAILEQVKLELTNDGVYY